MLKKLFKFVILPVLVIAALYIIAPFRKAQLLEWILSVSLAPEQQIEPGVYTNQLNISTSTFAKSDVGAVGAIYDADGQLIIAGSTGASFGKIDAPTGRKVSFDTPPINGTRYIRQHKIAKTNAGLRFYNNDWLRDETGSILAGIRAVQAFEEVRQADVNSDGVVDFFLVKQTNPYLFRGTFKVAVDPAGNIMAPAEYEKYYPIFLYDKVVEYPPGSGEWYYQKTEAIQGELTTQLYALHSTTTAQYVFPSGHNREPEGYTDIAVLPVQGVPHTAVLEALPYQGRRLAGFEDIDSRLTIYSERGELAYREVFEEKCETAATVMMRLKPTLLVACGNTIISYSTPK